MEKIFTGKDRDGTSYQILFNTVYTEAEAESVLATWLAEVGYSQAELDVIRTTSRSDAVVSRLAEQKNTVEERIQTIKIPTIMFDGRRYDRAVEPEKLNNLPN